MTEYEDCTECGGWCCAVAEVEFTYQDRRRVAKEFGMTLGEVTQQFSIQTTWGKEKRQTRAMKFRPCIFWTQFRCGIHDIKPNACAYFEPRDHCDKRTLKAVMNETLLVDINYREESE